MIFLHNLWDLSPAFAFAGLIVGLVKWAEASYAQRTDNERDES